MKNIKKYPYLSTNTNLINSFHIIGYPSDILHDNSLYEPIPQTQQDKDKSSNSNIKKYKIKDQIKPTILNSIYSDYSPDIFDEDLLVKLAFPNPPEIVQIISKLNDKNKEKLYINKEEMNLSNSSSSIVFYFNKDSVDSNKKTIQNGFGFIFFEKMKTKSEDEFYVHKCFLIISQYPYYNLFYNLLKKLRFIFTNPINYPLEIIIYNIVNYVPSPINKRIEIDLQYLFENTPLTSSKDTLINSKDTSLNMSSTTIQTKESNPNKAFRKRSSISDTDKVQLNASLSSLSSLNSKSLNASSFLNRSPLSKIKTSSHEQLNSLNMSFVLPQQKNRSSMHVLYPISSPSIDENLNHFSLGPLTGYPLNNYKTNLFLLIISEKIMVEIVIFSFLEIDMIYFHRNSEFLSLFMNTICNAAFPMTDSQYLWNIVTLNEEDLYKKNVFVGRLNNSMIGVATKYRDDICTKRFSDVHLIVDLYKGKIILKNYCDQDDVAGNKEARKVKFLLDAIEGYLDKINDDYVKGVNLISGGSKLEGVSTNKNLNFIKINSKSKGVFLYQIIDKMFKNIHISKAKVDSLSSGNSNSLKNSIFYEEGGEIKYEDMCFQFDCYNMVMDFLNVFYDFYEFKLNGISAGDLTNNVNCIVIGQKNNPIYKNFLDEEKIFFDLFSNSNKYCLFFKNFICENCCMDIYKIPMMFTEEFMYLKKQISNSNFDVGKNFFDIINNFYINDSENNNINESFTLSFGPFFRYYDANLREFFKDELKSSSLIKIKKQLNKENTQTFHYKYIELDIDILIKYKYILTNLDAKTFSELFPSLEIINDTYIESISSLYISSEIERSIRKNKILNKYDFLYISIILISIVLSVEYGIDKNIINFIRKLRFLNRKYSRLLLQTIVYVIESKIKKMEKEKEKMDDVNEIINRYNNKKSNNNISFQNEYILFYGMLNYLLEQNILPDNEMKIYIDKIEKYKVIHNINIREEMIKEKAEREKRKNKNNDSDNFNDQNKDIINNIAENIKFDIYDENNKVIKNINDIKVTLDSQILINYFGNIKSKGIDINQEIIEKEGLDMSFTMDTKNSAFRNRLKNNMDLLIGVTLNNKIFKKNVLTPISIYRESTLLAVGFLENNFSLSNVEENKNKMIQLISNILFYNYIFGVFKEEELECPKEIFISFLVDKIINKV